MKLWQFLKRWRQAYLDDKGDRIHAQIQAEKEMMEYYRAHPEEIPEEVDYTDVVLQAIHETALDACLKRGLFAK